MNDETKKIWFGLSIVLLLSAAGIFSFRTMSEERSAFSPDKVWIGERPYALERAETAFEREKGLGGRESLCDRCAMLFVFERPDMHAFWMKGMRFPLDIIWLFGEEIVHIERRISADSQQVFRPPRPADTVLEFNAGETDALSVGDRMRFSR